MKNVATSEVVSFEDFKKEVINDYKIARISRECSLLGRKEVTYLEKQNSEFLAMVKNSLNWH